MEAAFWHQKWAKGETAFHEGEANALLVKHFHALELAAGARVFLPLCGKTEDIPWLRQQGCRVVGIELSELAVEELFAGLEQRFGLTPKIEAIGDFRRYAAEGVEVWVGDVFQLSPEILGQVDAIYDRAALVALPDSLRSRYTAQLKALGQNAPQLLVTLEYAQSEMNGPPFSIDQKEIERHYRDHYQVSLLQQKVVDGRLKGKVDALESAWLLRA